MTGVNKKRAISGAVSFFIAGASAAAPPPSGDGNWDTTTGETSDVWRESNKKSLNGDNSGGGVISLFYILIAAVGLGFRHNGTK